MSLLAEWALPVMHRSAYGLTAAVMTTDEEAAIQIGDRIDTATWFMNRCDDLDPALASVGVKIRARVARYPGSATRT